MYNLLVGVGVFYSLQADGLGKANMNVRMSPQFSGKLLLPEDLSGFLHHLGFRNPYITEGVLPGYRCELMCNI